MQTKEENIVAVYFIERKFVAWYADAWGPKLKVPRRFSQHDIKRMTNKFNNENVLGEEGFFMGATRSKGGVQVPFATVVYHLIRLI